MVVLFGWSEQLKYGVQELDEQHKAMMDIFDELRVAVQSGVCSKVLQVLLIKLLDYVKYHFACEERLMGEHCYPLLDEHKGGHVTVIKQMSKFQEKFDAGDFFMSLGVLTFLHRCLVEHIDQSDRRYAEFLLKYRDRADMVKTQTSSD